MRSQFNNEFSTVRSYMYYNVDVEQLRKEMQLTLDKLKKLERTNSHTNTHGNKMTNPLHLYLRKSDRDEDGVTSPLT